MAKLIYTAITSLDGYIEDEQGKFDWAEPDEEVHRFANQLERGVGTYLYGRRMYDVMVYWETEGDDEDVTREYAQLWRQTDKIVYSRTLETVASERTRIERDFDVAAVAQMKQSATADLAISGPELAAQAMAAALVDECHVLINPVIVGGGKRALPLGMKADLELLEERRFASGVVHLHYRFTSS